MTAVHFELLNTLVATGRRRDLWRSELLLAGFFASIHLALVASAGLGAEAVASLETPLVESGTYLEVPAPSEPTSPRTAHKPRPVVVRAPTAQANRQIAGSRSGSPGAPGWASRPSSSPATKASPAPVASTDATLKPPTMPVAPSVMKTQPLGPSVTTIRR